MAVTVGFQRSKNAYLELESNLEALVSNKEFQDHMLAWLNAANMEIAQQFKQCDTTLRDMQKACFLDDGDYWNFRTLAQHCNLSIDEKRLIRRGQPIKNFLTWPESIKLMTTLNSLKSRGFVTGEQQSFLDRARDELKNVIFDRKELQMISNGLDTKLSAEIESQASGSDIEGFRRKIEALAPRLIELENQIEEARMNGDMAIVESMCYEQLDSHEEMLRLICEQYPILHRQHAETEDFKRRRRWAVFRMANKDVTCVVEAKTRQIEACIDDMNKIEEQKANYATDNQYQQKRYDLDCQESDQFLMENKKKQEAVWERIRELQQELTMCQDDLTKLASARRKEVDRRLMVEEREAGRRSGHESFRRTADKYKELLQDTIDNAQAAQNVARALNEFVLDGCDSVTARFDKQQETLSRMLNVIQKTHFKHFTDFYISCGRLSYHKERIIRLTDDRIDAKQMQRELAIDTFDPIAKKHADESQDLLSRKRYCIDQLEALKKRIQFAEQQVLPVMRAFDHRGVPYRHPKEVLAKMNLDRRERINDFRDEEDTKETAYMESDQHEIRAIEELRSDRKEAKPPKAPPYAYPSVQQQYSRYTRLLQESKPSGPPQAEKLHAIDDDDNDDSAARRGPIHAHQAPPVYGSAKKADGGDKGFGPSDRGAGAGGAGGGSGKPSATRSRALTDGATTKAIFAYKAAAPDELSFNRGDTIICVSAGSDEGWYTGVCNQKVGLFPTNFVQVIDE